MSAYLIPGLVLGTVYAISAAGLILTYSTTGVLNLAYGAIAYVVAEIFFDLRGQDHWPIPAAVAFCLLIVAPGLGLALWAGVFDRLERATLSVKLVATIGVAIALPSAVRMALPHAPVFSAPGVVANGNGILHGLGLRISENQLAALAGSAAAAVVLALVLHRTYRGLIMRAVQDEPSTAARLGVNARATSAAAWMLGSVIAGLAGILLAPILRLDSGVFTELTVASLSVALVGGLRRIDLAYIAGLILGVAESLVVKFVPPDNIISTSVRPSLPFVLLVVLLLVRRFDFDRGSVEEVQTSVTSGGYRLSRFLLLGVPAVAVLVLISLVENQYWNGVLALGAALAIVFLSFTISVGEAGMVPLSQASLAGVGAFTAGRLANEAGVPLLLAAVIGALVAMVVGAMLAGLGLRLGRLSFALCTLAFGLFCDQLVFNITRFVPALGVTFNPPNLFGFQIVTGRQYFLAYLTVFALLATALALLRSRVLGLFWSAVRGNPLLAESTGINPRVVRLGAFAGASFVVGLGGSLLGIYEGHLGPPDVVSGTGLVWLAVAVTVGARMAGAALVGGLVYALLPVWLASLGTRYGELPSVLFGLGAVSLAQDQRGVLPMWGDLLRVAGRSAIERLPRHRREGSEGHRGAQGSLADGASVEADEVGHVG